MSKTREWYSKHNTNYTNNVYSGIRACFEQTNDCIWKKKISNGSSQAVHKRRTGNSMTNERGQKDKQ